MLNHKSRCLDRKPSVGSSKSFKTRSELPLLCTFRQIYWPVKETWGWDLCFASQEIFEFYLKLLRADCDDLNTTWIMRCWFRSSFKWKLFWRYKTRIFFFFLNNLFSVNNLIKDHKFLWNFIYLRLTQGLKQF